MSQVPRHAALALAALGAAGCAAPRPLSLASPAAAAAAAPATPAQSAAAYREVLAGWTRSTAIYSGLDTRLFVTATFHAPELRRAFAAAFPDIYGRGGAITRRELVELGDGVEQSATFFVSAYTPVPLWNDLGRPDSIWRLSLGGAGDAQVTPSEVAQIKVDENLRAVYPYIGPFDRIYLVRFPLTDPVHRVVLDAHTAQMTLRLASALGVAELQWDLTPAP